MLNDRDWCCRRETQTLPLFRERSKVQKCPRFGPQSTEENVPVVTPWHLPQSALGSERSSREWLFHSVLLYALRNLLHWNECPRCVRVSTCAICSTVAHVENCGFTKTPIAAERLCGVINAKCGRDVHAVYKCKSGGRGSRQTEERRVEVLREWQDQNPLERMALE